MQTANTAHNNHKQCGLKSAAELDSFSQSLLAPLTEFNACLAEEPPLRVVGWDDRGDFKVNETELLVGSHLIISVWN